jgi:ribosomal protein L5
MKARLYEKYKNEVVPALKQKHNYKNVHQIPQLVKIVVNMGISASLEKGAMDDAAKDLTPDHGPQAGHQQIAQGDCAVQIAREPADRLPGDVAQGRDV